MSRRYLVKAAVLSGVLLVLVVRLWLVLLNVLCVLRKSWINFKKIANLPGISVGSQKVLSEKSKVKFYFSTVRSRVIPILKRVEVVIIHLRLPDCMDGANNMFFIILRNLKKLV